MPPRKSDQHRRSHAGSPDETVLSVAGNESHLSASEKKDKDKEKEHKDATTIEDLTLPKSIITRLAKGVLPPNTQIQANAILAMSKSATVFISYLASHANENTTNANKKTIAPADVFKALDDIEFGFLKEPLEAEFAKFNQIQTEKRTNYRQKVRAKHDGDGAAGDDTEMADTTVADTTMASESGGAPPAKKARVDPAAGEEEDAETEEEIEAHEDDEDDEDDEQVEEEEEAEEEQNGSGDETQDALEERVAREDGDEALDGDESD